MHFFDSYGWLALGEVEGRKTDVAPPAHDASPVVGQTWPNWTGVEWVMVPYAEFAPTPTKDQLNAPILAQLAEIDKLSDSPRARREALLGNTAWLATLDAQAATLRAQLVAL